MPNIKNNPNSNNNHWISITILTLLILAYFFTAFTIQQTEKELRKELTILGKLAAKSIDTHTFSLLKADMSDLQNIEYIKRKEQLSDMRSSISNSRFFYILGKNNNNKIFFYLDSEPENSKDYSPPGQIYDEVPKEVYDVFTQQKTNAIVGPYSDRWGKWISIFVPIYEKSNNKLIAVLGIDIDASNWNYTIFREAILSISLFFILLIMLFFIVYIIKNRKKIKLQQQVIIDSELRFRILFNNSPDAYFILQEFKIVDCNLSSEVLLQSNKKALLNKNFTDFLSLEYSEDNSNQGTFNSFVKYQDSQDKLKIEMLIKDFTQNELWVEINASKIILENKDSIFISCRDISIRKQIEEEMIELNNQLQISNDFAESNLFEKNLLIEELSATQEQLEIINSEKDKFFSIIAHDLKTPFSGFIGLTQLMVEDSQNMTASQINEYIVSLQKSATSIYKLLENLLDWAKMQRGITAYMPVPTSLISLVINNLELLSHSASKKHINFIENVDKECIVLVDMQMLNTVLRNIISNSIKFTKQNGQIEITSTKIENNYIQISIKDSGIGMNQTLMSKLFKLDERVSRLGTEGEASTGLGLLLCKDFIEKHNGKIWVESQEGIGTTFHFTIPMVG